MINPKTILNLVKSGLIPYLVGPRGEGKTSFIKDLASELGKNLTILNLSAIESSDFSGLPSIKDQKTLYAKPWFLDSEILFLDEIDRVRDNSVKSSLLSLLIDRKINGHELRPDCLIFTAGNGLGDNYDTIDFDEALKDRLISIEFKYTLNDKINYLRQKYPKNNFVKFLEVKPEIFDQASGRRIESFLKCENNELCHYFLGHEIARIYNHFIESNLITLKDISNGQYDFSQLSTISKTSLVIDLVNSFLSLDEDKQSAENLNEFINKLRPEEKANYFSRLKKLCLESPEKFKDKSKNLELLGFFSGQKEFLVELTK
jgi:predicted AAA+ superfamily ATPase